MVKRKLINKTIKDKILDFTKLLKDEGIKVDQIILYGSHAKGRANIHSDVDLCVVSKTFGKNSDKYFRKIWHLAARVDPSLEPIPFTPVELTNKYSALSAEINHSGIRIV